MPSIPFFGKKKEDSESAPPAEPAADAAAPEAAVDAAPAPAVDATPAASDASAPAVEKTVIEPKRSFFSRKRSTSENGAASESESEGPTGSRLPFFSRKAKPAPTVKEDEKENVPETAPEVAAEVAPAVETEAPAPPAEDKKDDGKVRRRISLFQRRNRAENATSEGEVTDGEKDAAVKAKRASFWKAAAPTEKEEPAPEDSRLTEAKAKLVAVTEAETAAKAALEDAKKAVRDQKVAIRNLEAEIAAEVKKAKAAAAAAAAKKDDKPAAVEEATAPTAIEPPALPQVAAAA